MQVVRVAKWHVVHGCVCEDFGLQLSVAERGMEYLVRINPDFCLKLARDMGSGVTITRAGSIATAIVRTSDSWYESIIFIAVA